MSQSDYQSLLETANALDADAVKIPYYPASIFAKVGLPGKHQGCACDFLLVYYTILQLKLPIPMKL